MRAKNSDYRKNAFDIIKIWAAISVMLKHYIRFSQVLFEKLPAPVQDQNAGTLKVFQRILVTAEFFEPVILFFVVSGFLTAASLERSRQGSGTALGTEMRAHSGSGSGALKAEVHPENRDAESAAAFLKKRFLRIYPELWLSSLIYLAVLLVTAPGLLDRSMLKWAAAQVFGIAYTPSCLKNYATGSMNGVLWMIFVLVQMYVLLAVFGKRLERLKPAGWLIFLTICGVCNLLCRSALAAAEAGDILSAAASAQSRMPVIFVSAVTILNSHNSVIGKVVERLFLPYALWYFTGVFCFRFRDTVIPFCRKYGWLCLTGTVLMQAAAGRLFPDIWSYGYYCGIGEGLCAAAAAILAAFTLPAVRVKRDITYEIFLYHWLFLNLWVSYDLIWSPMPAVMLAAFLCVSIAAAYMMQRIYKLTPGTFPGFNLLHR